MVVAPLDEASLDEPVRGAAVKAVSPAKRGRSAATRLDGGEHTRTLSASTAPAYHNILWSTASEKPAHSCARQQGTRWRTFSASGSSASPAVIPTVTTPSISPEFLKPLLDRTRDVVEAERTVQPATSEGRGRHALTELFEGPATTAPPSWSSES